MPTPDFFYLIGKPILDKYGRFKGKIIALDFDSNGDLNNIVFLNGGVILSKNKNSVVIDEDKVIIDNPDMIRAKKIIDKMDFLRLQLDTVMKIKDVSTDGKAFNELFHSLKSEFNNISIDTRNIIRRLEGRKKDIEKRKIRVEHLFYWLNVAKNANSIDNKIYMESFETLDRELVKLNGELEEIEYTLLSLSSRLSDLNEALTSYINSVSSNTSQNEFGGENIIEEDKVSEDLSNIVDSVEGVKNV